VAEPAPSAPPQVGLSLTKVAMGPIDLELAPVSESPATMPSVVIKAPTPGQALAADKAADFQVRLDVKGWDTKPGGNHVHLILDALPYKPIYDAQAPVRLGDLLPPGQSLAEGEHVLAAFPSRPSHESVKPDKGKSPLALVSFVVGKKGKTSFSAKAPMLVYSRPKGTYNGPRSTERLLVDFYLVNANLGDKQGSIRLTVSGPDADASKPFTIKEWRPYRLLNLRSGDYALTMELLDASGNPVPGPWNKTTRTVTVNRDAPDEPGMAPVPSPPPSAAPPPAASSQPAGP
jgi:hypothetical protein